MQSLNTLPGVQLVHMDVCSSDSIHAAVAEVVRKAGRIDVLVSAQQGGCAGCCACCSTQRQHTTTLVLQTGREIVFELAAVARLCLLTPTSCMSWDRRSTTQVRGTESQQLLCHLQVASGSTLQHAQLLLSEWQTLMSWAGVRPVPFLHTGVLMLGPTAEVPLAAVRQCFDANVFGLLELCQVGTSAAVLCCALVAAPG